MTYFESKYGKGSLHVREFKLTCPALKFPTKTNVSGLSKRPIRIEKIASQIVDNEVSCRGVDVEQLVWCL